MANDNIVDLNDPKMVEEIESWARRRAFKSLRLGFALVGEDLKIKFCNELFATMTGHQDAKSVLETSVITAVPELKSLDYWIQKSTEKRQNRVVADLHIVISDEEDNPRFFSLIVESLKEFGRSFMVIISEIHPDVMMDVHAIEALKDVYDHQENLRRINLQMHEVVREREASLRATQAFNEAVLSSTADGVVVIGPSGEIVQANYSAEFMLGADAGHLLGQDLWSYLDNEATSPEVVSALRAGDYSSFDDSTEMQFSPTGGENFFAEATINSLGLSDQDLFVVVLRDVTERVVRERKIAQHRKELRVLAARLVETQEDERRRIALDLHDDIGQRITGLSMALQQVFARLGISLGENAPELEKQIEETAGAVRALSMDLRPSVLDHFGLVDALDVLGRRFDERSNLRVTFKFESIKSGDRLVTQVESSAYRIIQEALNNVVKYAKVDEANVLVARRDDMLVVSIRDEGIGFDFDPKEASKKSVGILGMKERASQLGGELYVISRPNLGTTIMAELPLSNTTL